MAATSNSADSTFPNMSITVESNPSESRLSELDINSWPKWGCAPGKYILKFEAAETCYLVKGRVKVYPKGGSSSSVSFCRVWSRRPCDHAFPKDSVAYGMYQLPLMNTTSLSPLHPSQSSSSINIRRS